MRMRIALLILLSLLAAGLAVGNADTAQAQDELTITGITAPISLSSMEARRLPWTPAAPFERGSR